MANPFVERETLKKKQTASVGNVTEEFASTVTELKPVSGKSGGEVSEQSKSLSTLKPIDRHVTPKQASGNLLVANVEDRKTAHVGLLLKANMVTRLDAAQEAGGYRSRNALVEAIIEKYLVDSGF